MSEFEDECKDPGPEQCFSWEECYAEFSHEAPAAESDLTKIYASDNTKDIPPKCECRDSFFSGNRCLHCGGHFHPHY